MQRRTITIALMLMVCACREPTEQNASSNNPIAVPKAKRPEVPPPGTGPDARTPLGPVRPTIDPKSAAAARAVVDRYCAMLKSGRSRDAHQLWSDDPSTDAEFARNWTARGKLEGCAINEAARLEGAAGSIYTRVPVEFFFSGGIVKLSGWLTLRRVNDVPGSTVEQRRWHIVKSDLRPVD